MQDRSPAEPKAAQMATLLTAGLSGVLAERGLV